MMISLNINPYLSIIYLYFSHSDCMKI